MVAVGQRVAELYEVLVVGLIASPATQVPTAVSSADPPLETAHAETAEVLFYAAHVGVPAIDEASLGGGGDEDRAKRVERLGEVHHPFGGEVMKVTDERLELGDDVEHVGMADGSAELERAARSIHLPHHSVRLSQGVDRGPALSTPSLERDRPRVGHRRTVGVRRTVRELHREVLVPPTIGRKVGGSGERAVAPVVGGVSDSVDGVTSEPAEGPAIDAGRYRGVLGGFPTGVVVVTADTPGGPVGLAIGSFTSVSLVPPLVGFLPDKASSSWPRIEAAGSFCVNVLADDQVHVCAQFAARGADRYAGITWRVAATGAPVLDGALAWMDCAVESVVDAGDHHFVIGRVLDLGIARDDAGPLVFFRGRYGRFEPS